MTGNLSLYFHIPFCKKKCPYCHFYSIQQGKNFEKLFLLSLKKEWDQKKELLLQKKTKILSIYFGGGTPSLLGKNLEEILQWIFQTLPIDPSCEITLETNPDDVTEEKCQIFQKIGINRISIGIQSFSEKNLKTLQRNHTVEKNLEILDLVAKYIKNISIDLMYDIPDQTLSDWEKTLSYLPSLPITHLSLYNLTFEPNTLFFKKRKLLLPKVPSQKTSLQFLEMAIETLKKLSFSHYEISAFCKNNKFSIHNIGYWTAREFLGFGPSAFSYFNQTRFKNSSNLIDYAKRLEQNLSCVDFEEKLPSPNDKQELLVLALRLLQGVNIETFQKTHGNLEKNTLSSLENFVKDQLLIRENALYKLSKKGLLFYDTIATELI